MPKINRNPRIFNYFDDLNKRYLRFLNTLDRQITSNLCEAEIQTRPVSSNGLWCCTILPSVLIVYNLICKVPPVYSLVTYVSIGLLCYCALFMVFLSISCLVLQEPMYGGCLASSFVTALLLYMFLGKGLTTSLIYSIPALLAFTTLLRTSLMEFPKTFTIGEAMIVAQSIVLYGVMTTANWFDDTVNMELDFISGIVNTVLSTVGIIVTALCLMNDRQRNLWNLGIVVAVAAIFGIALLHITLGIDCMWRIYDYFRDVKRMELLSFWLAVVIISVCVLLFRTKLAVKATTVTRKAFHLLASTVFLSGIVCDQGLMTMAAGVGLGLLVLIEALRKSGIEPFSSSLQSAFLVYSDEKDSGTFAMTPFYLYCGLACPLLLVPARGGGGGAGGGARLELLSGVLAIGVGDTAASWFGSRYGFSKWAGTGKTVEGTVFNILCQILTVYALQLFDLIDTPFALIRAAVAATVSGVSEAMTVQVDNLILPLITLMAFQATSFLS